jgi:hypothetical protein
MQATPSPPGNASAEHPGKTGATYKAAIRAKAGSAPVDIAACWLSAMLKIAPRARRHTFGQDEPPNLQRFDYAKGFRVEAALGTDEITHFAVHKFFAAMFFGRQVPHSRGLSATRPKYLSD